MKPTIIFIENHEDPLFKVLEVLFSHGKLYHDNFSCSVSYTLEDKTKIQFTYWEFGSLSICGSIHKNDPFENRLDFNIMGRKFKYFKTDYFPGFDRIQDIIVERRIEKTNNDLNEVQRILNKLFTELNIKESN